MNATIIARTPTSFTLQVEVPYNDSMLGFEEALQQRLNDAGVLATAEGLKRFDTDGAPITVGAVKLTTKGPVEKDYQTPYGVATVARHVYQSPDGGKTYCAPGKLGKGGSDVAQKPFAGTLRVTNPVRQSLASSRKRVLRGPGATRAAKRRQRVSGSCDGAPKYPTSREPTS